MTPAPAAPTQTQPQPPQDPTPRPDPPPGAPTGPRKQQAGILPSGTKICRKCARHGHIAQECKTRIARPWQEVEERTTRRGLGTARGQGPKPNRPASIPASRPIEFTRGRIDKEEEESLGGQKEAMVRIQVGTKGGWTPQYDRDPSSKVGEKKQMTQAMEEYKQFKGIRCTNIGWRAEFPKEKLYTFEIPERNMTDPEILARVVISTRRVVEKTLEITGAPFGDWVEVIVKGVNAGKNSTSEDYANRIAKTMHGHAHQGRQSG